MITPLFGVQLPPPNVFGFVVIVSVALTATQPLVLPQATLLRFWSVPLATTDQVPPPKALVLIRILPSPTATQAVAVGQVTLERACSVMLGADAQLPPPKVLVLVKIVPLPPTPMQALVVAQAMAARGGPLLMVVQLPPPNGLVLI